MEAERVICQRRLGRRTEFRFGQDKLAFSLSDPSGQIDSSVFYEAIDAENTSLVSVNAGKRYYWAAAILAIAVSLLLSGSPITRSYSVVPLAAYLVFLSATRYKRVFFVPYTILGVSGANPSNRIRIIRGKDHDQVLDGITAGRRARLRKLHMTVNATNDPKAEARRFRWLLDNQIIDETEYGHAISQIDARLKTSTINIGGSEIGGLPN